MGKSISPQLARLEIYWAALSDFREPAMNSRRGEDYTFAPADEG